MQKDMLKLKQKKNIKNKKKIRRRKDFKKNIYLYFMINTFILYNLKYCYYANKRNTKFKYLYFVFQEIIKYVEKLSNFRLNIIKDLLSKVIIENNFFMFINVYNQAFSVLTECHCDLNLFEATKFFIFRLYQYDFYKKYSYILRLYDKKSDKDKIGYIDLK